MTDTPADTGSAIQPDQHTGDLAQRFTYHPPRDDQPTRYRQLRDATFLLACKYKTHTPASREQAIALTKLEEAVFWANAAIARNE